MSIACRGTGRRLTYVLGKPGLVANSNGAEQDFAGGGREVGNGMSSK